MNKLPKRFKTRFVKALRGNLKQGNSNLFYPYNNSYCCLGVACRVAGMKPEVYANGGYIDSQFKGVNRVPEILHEEQEIPRQLAILNDDGVPFEVIAGFIHYNL